MALLLPMVFDTPKYIVVMDAMATEVAIIAPEIFMLLWYLSVRVTAAPPPSTFSAASLDMGGVLIGPYSSSPLK